AAFMSLTPQPQKKLRISTLDITQIMRFTYSAWGVQSTSTPRAGLSRSRRTRLRICGWDTFALTVVMSFLSGTQRRGLPGMQRLSDAIQLRPWQALKCRAGAWNTKTDGVPSNPNTVRVIIWNQYHQVAVVHCPNHDWVGLLGGTHDGTPGAARRAAARYATEQTGHEVDIVSPEISEGQQQPRGHLNRTVTELWLGQIIVRRADGSQPATRAPNMDQGLGLEWWDPNDARATFSHGPRGGEDGEKSDSQLTRQEEQGEDGAEDGADGDGQGGTAGQQQSARAKAAPRDPRVIEGTSRYGRKIGRVSKDDWFK
ncbi:hypothetical protein LTR36_004570, partial [Oleoguttula mirabilis]